jgi:hypothetical protein
MGPTPEVGGGTQWFGQPDESGKPRVELLGVGEAPGSLSERKGETAVDPIRCPVVKRRVTVLVVAKTDPPGDGFTTAPVHDRRRAPKATGHGNTGAIGRQHMERMVDGRIAHQVRPNAVLGVRPTRVPHMESCYRIRFRNKVPANISRPAKPNPSVGETAVQRMPATVLDTNLLVPFTAPSTP